MVPTVDGVVSNWGGFPGDVSVSDEWKNNKKYVSFWKYGRVSRESLTDEEIETAVTLPKLPSTIDENSDSIIEVNGIYYKLSVPYSGMMKKYFEIQKILLNGIKLKETKKTNNNCFYTDNIKIWDTNPSAYTVCDISKFGVNGRKLYYIKNFSTAQTQDAKIGDICYYDNVYQVYYGNGE